MVDWAYLSSAYAVIGDRNTARQTAVDGIKAYREGHFGNLDGLSAPETYHLGRLATDAGDSALQLTAYSRFVETTESSPDKLARALSDLGFAHLAAGRYEKARASLGRAVELVPASRLPGTRFAYAASLFRLKRYPEAEVQWERVRFEDRLREAQAGYARELMRTLAQEELLLDSSTPLPDLTGSGRADLEEGMLKIAAEMGEVAGQVPAQDLRRGFVDRRADAETRESMRRFRDLKCRLAHAAAEYVARGYPLREFAFTNGLQGSIRAWNRLPLARKEMPLGEIPSFLPKEEIAKWEAIRARLEKQRQERKTGEQSAGTEKPDKGEEGGEGKNSRTHSSAPKP